MEQKGKTNKNSVNITSKSKSAYPNKDNGNAKIIIAALILAVLIGVLVYFQVSKDKKVEDKEPEKKEIVDDKTEVEEPEEEIAEVEEYTNQPVEIIQVTKQKEDEEDEVVIEETYYSITFETNGADDAIDKQILTSEEVSTEVTPERDGWIFDGWYKDSEFTEKYEFGSSISEDITLYAKWVKNVNFIVDQEAISTVQYAENDIIELLTKDALDDEDKENFEIAWLYGSEGYDGEINYKEVTDGTKVNDLDNDSEEIDLILERLQKFVVKFYADEESDEPLHEQTVVEKRVIPFDDANEKVRAQFEDLDEFGWYYKDDQGSKWNFGANKRADKEITELFLSGVYTVVFEENENDEPVILEEQQVAKDSHMSEDTIPVPEEKEGFEFKGWIDTESPREQILDENMIIDGNKIFVPKWEEKVNLDAQLRVVEEPQVDGDNKEEKDIEQNEEIIKQNEEVNEPEKVNTNNEEVQNTTNEEQINNQNQE